MFGSLYFGSGYLGQSYRDEIVTSTLALSATQTQSAFLQTDIRRLYSITLTATQPQTPTFGSSGANLIDFGANTFGAPFFGQYFAGFKSQIIPKILAATVAPIATLGMHVFRMYPIELSVMQTQAASLEMQVFRQIRLTLSTTQAQIASLVHSLGTLVRTLTATQSQVASLSIFRPVETIQLEPAMATLRITVPTSGTFPVLPSTPIVSITPTAARTFPPVIHVNIGGFNYPFMPNSLHVNNAAGQVETFDIHISDPHGAYTINLNQPIIVTEGAVTLFVGDVDEVEYLPWDSAYATRLDGTHDSSPVGARVLAIKGVGLTALANRYLTNQFSAQVKVPISTVVSTLAGLMGVASSVVTIPADLALPDSFLSDHEPIAAALTRLSDLATQLTGVPYLWRISWPGTSFAATQLQFYPVTNIQAGPAVGHGGGYSPRAGSIRIRYTREQFANAVFLRIDHYLRPDAQVEDYPTSSIFQGTLSLLYACAGAPRVEVVGESPDPTVGIKDVDTGKDWYWNVGSNVLTLDPSYTPSGAITVTYQAQDPRTISETNPTSIGLYGQFTAALSAGDTNNTLSPRSLAKAELARRSQFTTVVRVQVNCPPGLFVPGQMVSVTLQKEGIYGSCYLRSVSQSDEGAAIIWRELELMQGPEVYTASKYLQRLTR